MSIHLFWHVDEIVTKDGKKIKGLHAHSGGHPPDPEHMRNILMTRNFPGAKSCTLPKLIEEATPEDLAGHPVLKNIPTAAATPAALPEPPTMGSEAPQEAPQEATPDDASPN